MFCISAPISPAGAGALSLIWAHGHPTTSELTVRTRTRGDHLALRVAGDRGTAWGLRTRSPAPVKGRKQKLHGLGKAIYPPSLSQGLERLTSQCPQPNTWAEVSGVGGRSRSWGRVGGGGQTRAPDFACTGREGSHGVRAAQASPAPSSSEQSQAAFRAGALPLLPNSEEASQLDSSQ